VRYWKENKVESLVQFDRVEKNIDCKHFFNKKRNLLIESYYICRLLTH